MQPGRMGAENGVYQRQSIGMIMQSVIKYATGFCSLGIVVVAFSEKGICAILLGEHATSLVKYLQRRFPASRLEDAADGLDRLLDQVIKFIDSPGLGLNVSL